MISAAPYGERRRFRETADAPALWCKAYYVTESAKAHPPRIGILGAMGSEEATAKDLTCMPGVIEIICMLQPPIYH